MWLGPNGVVSRRLNDGDHTVQRRLDGVALGQRQSALRALGGSPGPCASREAAWLPGMDCCGGGSEVSGGRSSAVYGQGAVVH